MSDLGNLLIPSRDAIVTQIWHWIAERKYAHGMMKGAQSHQDLNEGAIEKIQRKGLNDLIDEIIGESLEEIAKADSMILIWKRRLKKHYLIDFDGNLSEEEMARDVTKKTATHDEVLKLISDAGMWEDASAKLWIERSLLPALKKHFNGTNTSEKEEQKAVPD